MSRAITASEPVPATSIPSTPEIAELEAAGDPQQKPHDESEIILAEQQYRAIFEASSDGLVITDLDSELVIEANPAFCRMHGYDRMDGLHPSTFIHHNSHHLFKEYLDAVRAGQEYRCTAQDVRRDGSVFDVEVVGQSFYFGGKPAILGVVRDVTEHVRAYQDLEQHVAERTREIERRREVAEGLRDLLATVNSRPELDDIMDYVVEQSCNLLGCDASSIFISVEDDELGEVLVARATRSLDPELMQVRLPVGQSSTGLAYHEMRPVIVPDIRSALPAVTGRKEDLGTNEHPEYIEVHHLPLVLEYSLQSKSDEPGRLLRAFAAAYGALLAVPLAVKDERYGVLTLYYQDPREFKQDEIALAQAFADQTALALENARLREQAEQAAVLEDRQQLARELHDAVTQTLFSASLIAEILPEIWATDPTEARHRLDQLRRLTRGALAEMRLLLFELRPQVLADLALSDLLRQIADAASGSSGAEFTVQIDGQSSTCLPAEVQIAFYRIAQESMNNIAKHAKANRATIQLTYNTTGGIMMVVADDGCGFNHTTNQPGHFGLNNIRERAREIGATVHIESHIGLGTSVELTWNGNIEATS